MTNIVFRDLKRQYNYIRQAVDKNIAAVVESSNFIGGPEVKKIETQLAIYTGRKNCITCANGTDAISIALFAAGIGVGDAVFVPDFTFFSSGECPAFCGATPIFVDVNMDTYNISAESLTSAVKEVVAEGKLRPAAVVAVDLFGQPFDYEAIKAICDEYDMLLLEDAAQGFGGEYECNDGIKKMAGSLGEISTTSFFPAKPLGCYGDGGAIFTDDDELATMCRSIAVHGKDMQHPDDPNAKYNNTRIGMNSRLDTIQAGVLLAKFEVFRDEELDMVNHVAEKYTELLIDIDGVALPRVAKQYYSSWAQYTIQLPEKVDRARVQKELRSQGIPTNVYYPRPMHTQGAFVNTRSAIAECPNTEKLCASVLCLPIHPYMEDREVEIVCDKLKDALIGEQNDNN